MTGPNFFVVGAAKSGTTTLFHALRAHPDVFVPDMKEPHVYCYLADASKARHLFTDEAAARRRYAEIYAGVQGQAAVGDCSTTNLVVPGAAAAIAADVPDARIVAILRQPVDRAHSHWWHFVSARGESEHDFATAVSQEGARQSAGYPFTYQYLGWGRYADQLAPYYELFGRERVLVHTYDDLVADATILVRRTFAFLGIDEAVALPPVGRYNELTAQRKGRLRLRKRTVGKPALDPRLRAELTRQFDEEIDRLEKLLDRDLSGWR